MKLPSLKVVLLTPLVLFGLFYAIGAVLLAQRDQAIIELAESPTVLLEVAILGASGTAGDGILEAALASPDINRIQVISRRLTPRIQAGVDSGKVELTLHNDYLNYSEVFDQLSNVDAVFWAIGISSVGVDEKTYGMIHVDFPMQFVKAWTQASNKQDISFQFISSSDISENSSAMWVREKIRAEKSLFEFAQGTKLRVIAYRPDYIGPTKQQAHIGQDLLYWFFKPVGAAVRAAQIGQAMIDVTLRGANFENGSKLSTNKIVRHSQAYQTR
ncbi:MAG: hypothetical protein ACI9LY_003365 [Arenicella sp.]|jgi:hypothetical protein